MKLSFSPEALFGTVLLLVSISIGCRHSVRDQPLIQLQAPIKKAPVQGVIDDASTPLRIRGGAMTFRSPNPWNAIGKGYCTSLIVKSVWVVGADSKSSLLALVPPTGWSATLSGRDTSGTSAGDVVTIQPAMCEGSPGVAITPINASKSGFYKGSIDEDGETFSIRYKNLAKKIKDKDLVEHMGQITLNNGSKLPPKRCDNGECTVEFRVE